MNKLYKGVALFIVLAWIFGAIGYEAVTFFEVVIYKILAGGTSSVLFFVIFIALSEKLGLE